jgi:hypothetical protein
MSRLLKPGNITRAAPPTPKRSPGARIWNAKWHAFLKMYWQKACTLKINDA